MLTRLRIAWLIAVLGIVAAPAAPALAQSSGDETELAKKTQNPVADLISVPFQSNFNFGVGSKDATVYVLNVEPVIPLHLNADWNLITRTIVPVIYAESPVKGGSDKSGLGDIVQSFFFSPKAPVGGWILAAGPVMLYPTATDKALGFGKWGAGPTALALQQNHGWTYGMLVNHLWSYADAGRYAASDAGDASDGSGGQVNATFIQPFVSYTTKTFTTFGLNTESTYDWSNNQWTVPLNVSVSQFLKLGKQPIQLSLGAKYYADGPSGGPDWGLRFAITFLFPK